MGLFNKKNPDVETEVEETPQKPGNPSNMMLIRLIAVGYVLWLYKDIVQKHIEGGEGAPSLTMVIVVGAVFLAGCAWIGVMTWRQYKRMKAELYEYNEAMAEQARLEEEAAAAAAEAEETEEIEQIEETEGPEEE